MQIGILLRSLNEKGGIGIYTHNITRELLELDRDNQYVLFYNDPANLGRFNQYENAVEYVIQAPGKAIWDQVSIPAAARKWKIDVLFHPKFTVPIFSPCKTVMVLHGAGWFMEEYNHFWKKWDLRYLRAVMPVYCRRASRVLSVSQLTTDTFNRVFRLPADKIHTVYFAPARIFNRVTDRKKLDEVRNKYGLPERYIFTLSGYDRGDRKNFAGILNAFKIHYGRTPHKLVVGGKDCEKFKIDYNIPDEGYGKEILFTGWIEQEDLPALYTLSDLFLYPSNVEAFPIPITEALACGTPIVTSNANGLREIVGEAALLADPSNYSEIADSVCKVLMDADLRSELSAKSKQRSALFTWDKCVRQTLDHIQSTVSVP